MQTVKDYEKEIDGYLTTIDSMQWQISKLQARNKFLTDQVRAMRNCHNCLYFECGKCTLHQKTNQTCVIRNRWEMRKEEEEDA